MELYVLYHTLHLDQLKEVNVMLDDMQSLTKENAMNCAKLMEKFLVNSKRWAELENRAMDAGDNTEAVRRAMEKMKIIAEANNGLYDSLKGIYDNDDRRGRA